MRKIKFRGIAISDDKFKYGNLTISDGLYHIGHHNSNNFYVFCQVNHETVGQLTGLCDKNEVEIYEGDICDFANLHGDMKRGFIKYRDGCFRFSTKLNVVNEYDAEVRMWNDGNNDWYSIENIESFELEVMGNIHQNPELLQ